MIRFTILTILVLTIFACNNSSTMNISTQTLLQYSEACDIKDNSTKNAIYSPDGSKLAFLYSNDLYISDSDRNNRKKIKSDVGGRNLSWSPDNKKIAINYADDIHIINLADSSLNYLSKENTTTFISDSYSEHAKRNYLTWTPDGKNIIYDKYSEGLFILNIESKSQKKLIADSLVKNNFGIQNDYINIYPSQSISPNGKFLAFAYGYDIFLLELENNKILRLSSEGKNITNIDWTSDSSKVVYTTKNDDVKIIDTNGSSKLSLNDFMPNLPKSNAVFSPDDKKIAYIGGLESKSLYIFDIASKIITKVNDYSSSIYKIQWSSDGNKILVNTEKEVIKNTYQKFSIYESSFYDIESKNVSPVSPVKVNNYNLSPSLSKDNSQILYISGNDGNSEIYKMNSDGSNQVRITNTTDSNESFPAWSPDNKKISFITDKSGKEELYIMNSDGSNEEKISIVDHSEKPTWSPNSSKIAFITPNSYEIKIYDINSKKTINLEMSHIPNDYSSNKRATGINWFSNSILIFENSSNIVFLNLENKVVKKIGSGVNSYSIDSDQQNIFYTSKIFIDSGTFFNTTFNFKVYKTNLNTGYEEAIFNSVENVSNNKTFLQIKKASSELVYLAYKDNTNNTRIESFDFYSRNTKLLNPKGCLESDVEVSSDGKKIFFVSMEDGYFNIYSINPDGSSMKKLTSVIN